MVFNWFNRQLNKRPATPQQEAQTTSTPSAEEPTEENSTEKASQDVEADTLLYAKAAFKQIQQQRAQQAQEATATTELSALSTSELVVDADSRTEVPTVEDGNVEVSVVESNITDADANSAVVESIPIEDGDNSTVTATDAEQTEAPTAAPEVSETAPLPFWAKAEAEKQARLERLKATAIEISESVEMPAAAKISEAIPTTPTNPEVEAAPEGLAFDEGFLWSAEILAAQGRRPEDISVEEITWLKKLRQGLDKTRRNLVNQLKAIVGQGPLNQAAVMEIEALLLQADVGVEATDTIITTLQNKLRSEVLPPEAAIADLKKILRDMLDAPLQQAYNPIFAPEKDTLNIWLIVGVNGAGKTTTIGKIAHIAQKSGYECLIGAADTFRAAAVEQVKIWGQRSGIEVIANPGQNTDPAAVVFDAIAAATARGTELLLIDTAGRLQNKKNLMDELSKIRRIVNKKAPEAKVEALLVLDATLGQNGLRQAEVFAEAAQLSGVVLTKLDGTAKGGIALAVVQQLNLPIRFIGAGGGIEDLRPFSSYEFVEALLSS
ncbi:MAG: signal recognition particle-docking protein FtsY [Chroococcidiopsidaceae cyanobacterium CP_BM_RX_35]|nr:signal recognition particle-docking protein FtsY [Chroococcidiopsidaceae cyanobacterium CP_BM_RX_35]